MILVKHTYNYAKYGGNDGCTAHGISGTDKIDQRNDRDQKVNSRKKHLPLRKIFLGNSFKTKSLGTEMNHKEDTGEVKYRRKNGSYNDIGIRHTDHLCHKECSCTHDRRHDLSSCRGSCFNRTCELSRESGFLHHRDGNRTSGNSITNRRSGNHTAKSTGNNRNLCGTAGC